MKTYIALVPKLEFTGPVIIALEICRVMEKAGYDAQIYSLANTELEFFDGVKCGTLNLKKALSLNSDTVVHSHTYRPDLVNALLTLFKGVNSVTTIHSFFQHALYLDYGVCKTQVAYFFWKNAVNRLKKRVFISGAMERYYKYRLKRQGSYLIKNWRQVKQTTETDISFEKALTFIKRERELSRKILIFCGSLDDRKNIIKLINNIGTTISLLILGDGPMRDKVSALSESKSNVLYLGKKKSVIAYMRECDALVLPSLAEGIPTVCLEAASLGVPSVLSNIAVHRELQQDGVAVTFNHRNFIDFKQAVDKTLNLQSSTVKDIWRQKFNGDLGARKYLEVIDK